MTDRRSVLHATAAAAVAAAMPGLARAQAFPNRPIRLICPWTAGGTTDIVMRSWAESASRMLAHPPPRRCAA